MKLISWNLNGLEDKNLDIRTEAAMFQMLLGAPIEQAMKQGFKPNSPDIILLQEVVPRTFHAHILPHLQAAGFTIFPKQPSERSYFEVIATRAPMLESSYKTFSYTQQNRGLSIVTIKGLTIMTAHLESQKAGKHMRVEQAREILEQMNNDNNPCIFAGDTNLRESEWQDLEAKNVKDAWESTGSLKKHKTTWQNPPYKARFDRVWHSQIEVTDFETIGAKKIPSCGERPSDHLGIRTTFKHK